MMEQQVYAQALLLTGALEERQMQLLRVLCRASASALALRLKEGLGPQDCAEDFIAAASLFAVAALDSAREETVLEEFKAGDLTVRQSAADRTSAARALEKQAQMLMKPYLADGFTFVGV